MIDYRGKQRVTIEGVKYYKHPVFNNYAACKNGDIINVKTKRIMKMTKNSGGYLFFNISCKKLEKKNKIIVNIDLYMRFLEDQFQVVFKLITSTKLKQIIE